MLLVSYLAQRSPVTHDQVIVRHQNVERRTLNVLLPEKLALIRSSVIEHLYRIIEILKCQSCSTLV